MKRLNGPWLCAILCATVSLASCGQAQQAHTSAAAPASSSATNPPGDIPDSQQFVRYTSSAGYSALYPEGWARTRAANGDVTFVWSYDGERLGSASSAAPAPSTTDPSVVAIAKRFDQVTGMHLTASTLPGGSAVVATFRSLSKPDAVTAKRIPLDNKTFVYSKNGRIAVLDLWAPAGADNVDQWLKISRSFAWR